MPELSPDAAVYRDTVAAGSGLAARVVTAWIACESGWGVNKPGHNYLNIGPGRTYPDVATAARDAIATLHNGLYGDVLAATDPAGQVAALKASPWDAGHYSSGCLDQVFTELGGATLTAAAPIAATSAAISLGGIADTVTGFFSDALGLNDLLAQVLQIVVSGVFLAAAFGIIVLGLNRLTAGPTRDRLTGVASDAANIAALAAV